MVESRLNIELFKKVRERIATIPESFDQRRWCKNSKRSPCGTVACLAGETIICAAPNVKVGIEKLRDTLHVPTSAAQLLGLRGNYYQFDNDECAIFRSDGSGFPEPFKTAYRRARKLNDKAMVVVQYLDRVIETGKVLE